MKLFDTLCSEKSSLSFKNAFGSIFVFEANLIETFLYPKYFVDS